MQHDVMEDAAVLPEAELAATPLHPSRAREHVIRAVAILAVVYGTYWIGWRWMNTINTASGALVPSLLLVIAETWAFINTCLFVFLTWKLTNRDPGPPPA